MLFHYALFAHAIRIMMKSACLIAFVVTWLQWYRLYASNCQQKPFIKAKREKSKGRKVAVACSLGLRGFTPLFHREF